MNLREKNMLFTSELKKLYDNHYIDIEDYNKIGKAHFDYCVKLSEKSVNEQKAEAENKVITKVDVKKVKTSEEIRNRNITVILSIGVMMVILAGLIFATSSWNSFTNGAKVIMLCLFSLFFFGISHITDKKLHVHQTASAFWFLGCISLPIVVLALGALGLLGESLTLASKGRFWLLSLVTLVGIPINVYSSIKFKNTLYAWFSYLFLVLFGLFLFPALRIPREWIFLFVAIFHGLLTYYVLRNKSNERYHYLVKAYIDLAPILIMITSYTSLIIKDGTLGSADLSNGAFVVFGIGFIVLAIDYMLLSIVVQGTYAEKVSGYLSPILIAIGILIASRIGDDEYISFNSFILFGLGCMLYGIYLFAPLKLIEKYKPAYGICAMFLILMGWITALADEMFVLQLVLALIVSVILYITYLLKENEIIRWFIKISLPIILALGIFVSVHEIIYEPLNDYFISVSLGVVLLITTGIGLLLRYLNKKRALEDDISAAFWPVSLFMSFIGILALIYENNFMNTQDIQLIILPFSMLLIYFYHFIRSKITKVPNMYIILVTLFIILNQLLLIMDIQLPLILNLISLYGVGLMIVAYIVKHQWKRWIYYFALILSVVGLLLMGMDIPYEGGLTGMWNFFIIVIMCGILIVSLHKFRMSYLNIIPLAIFAIMIMEYLDLLITTPWLYIASVIVIVYLLIFLGRWQYIKVDKLKRYKLEWYSLISFILLLGLFTDVIKEEYMVLRIITALSFVIFFGAQIRRYTHKGAIKLFKGLTWASGLIGLFTIYEYMSIPHLIETELYVLPIFLTASLIIHFLYKEHYAKLKYLEYSLLTITTLILFLDIMPDKTFEGILFGGLMIGMIIIGFYKKQRFYFISAIVFLGLDVIYFTKTFWLSIPWWVYLLVAGLFLIIFASINEYKKSKKKDSEVD
ncbi:hypothetical protein [Vallitalea okinawensis]|uniref:hypothetical protein n=1 Tax=Vallitalea okinawensis TaxID=2078660 RepID=UPI000CFBE3EC|nr:hypothetical protein [Vallitalea okinawensis]